MMGKHVNKIQSKPDDLGVSSHSTNDKTVKLTTHIISKSSLQQRRLATAKCVTEFHFIKKRVRVLSSENKVSESRSGGVLYWMSRDARVQDNWAFLFAQRLALKFELPLLIAFCVDLNCHNITLRQCKFLIDGLEEVEKECANLCIPFYVLLEPVDVCLPEMVHLSNISVVVCDFNPLREPQLWLEKLKAALPIDVPFTQVDAHNVVPLWVTSDKQEFVPFYMRRRINPKLKEFLTEFPPVIKHPHNKNVMHSHEWVDWNAVQASIQCDRSVGVVEWAKPGYIAACAQLEEFCVERLRIYSEKRKDPTVDALSGLSPWLHFGQISAQRCVLEVMRYISNYSSSVESFCESAIIRRELADNFCYYNKNYDSLKGLYSWAANTLEEHRIDKRDPSYTPSELEKAHTHDDLWNAAQLQLVREGKMHGFLRIYWAKKILEWSSTPELALETAINMNDKYSLDGRDPSGYVGCMTSIGALHEGATRPRPIFGKVRYMNYKGCQRKFDVEAFVTRYGAKMHE